MFEITAVAYTKTCRPSAHRVIMLKNNKAKIVCMFNFFFQIKSKRVHKGGNLQKIKKMDIKIIIVEIKFTFLT